MDYVTEGAELLRQSLSDSGCTKEQIKQCVSWYREGNRETVTVLLRQQKQRLLEQMHRKQKQIDCLDYLTYQMEKGKI